jgi:hypothetical protein
MRYVPLHESTSASPRCRQLPAGRVLGKHREKPAGLPSPTAQGVGAALPPVQNEPAGHVEKLLHMIAPQ